MNPTTRSPARIALWTIAALSALATLLLLIVTLALPGWVTGRGAALTSEALGRPVIIEEASFQPWRLALIVEGLTIAGAKAGQPPLFKLRKMDAALSLRSLLRGHAVVESLSLTRPELRLARLDEGRYDIDDLIQRFAAKPGAPDETEPEFAIYNIELSDGQILFDDRPVQRQHELAGLHLALPFVSTLPADIKVKVLPHLSGRLNGVAFDSRAEALPFAEDASARLSFKLAGLDLAPLAAYVPASAPVRLGGGKLDIDLAVDFAERSRQPSGVKLSGHIQLHDLALALPDGQALLGFKRLSLPLADVQPLRRQLGLGQILLESPDAWQRPLPAGQGGASGPAAAPWHVSVAGVEIKDGRFNVDKDLALEAIQVKLGAAAWPIKSPTRLDASLRLGDATLSAQATLSRELLEADAELTGLALERLSTWLPLPVGTKLAAAVSTKAGLRLKDPLADGAVNRLQMTLANARMADVRLALPGAPKLLTLVSVQLDKASIEPSARAVALGSLTLDTPRAQLARERDGRLNFAALMAPDGAASGPAGPAWKLQLAGLTVERGALRWRDAAVPAGMAPVALAVEPLRAQLGAVNWPATAPLQARLSAQIAALGASDQPIAASAGSLEWNGSFGLAPLSANGALQAKALPLQLLNAYLDPAWGLHLQRAEMGLKAEVNAVQQASGAWQAGMGGDARIGPMALMQTRSIGGQRVVGEDLLSWQLLQLDGLKLALAPGAPPRLAVREAQLDDAYARLIVNEQGRFNLRDIGPAEAASAPAPAASGPTPEFAAEQIGRAHV